MLIGDSKLLILLSVSLFVTQVCLAKERDREDGVK